MRRHRRAARRSEAAELNITAFMNLMVVLVPFLLITAVFSRLTILELDLPSDSVEVPQQPSLRLRLQVAEERLRVFDGGRQLRSWAAPDGAYPLEELGELLGDLKRRHPSVDGAELLLEGSVSYDSLVQLMDTVRIDADGAAMFARISLGELAAASGEGRQ